MCEVKADPSFTMLAAPAIDACSRGLPQRPMSDGRAKVTVTVSQCADLWALAGVNQVLFLTAHELNQLIIDNFHKLLIRLDSFDDLDSQSRLLHFLHKATHDRKGDLQNEQLLSRHYRVRLALVQQQVRCVLLVASA